MSDLRTAAQQALEALDCPGKAKTTDEQAAITALRAALEQPEQEPVAWGDLAKEAEEIVRSKWVFKKWIDGTPLENDIAVWMADFAIEHTHPPRREWRGLTEEEKLQILDDTMEGGDLMDMARAIEQALKEKNHE